MYPFVTIVALYPVWRVIKLTQTHRTTISIILRQFLSSFLSLFQFFDLPLFVEALRLPLPLFPALLRPFTLLCSVISGFIAG